MPRKPKPSSAPAYRVFLSHATADKFVARCMMEKIEAAGAKVFIDDRDIEGGGDIPAAIVREIQSAQEFVLLLTPKSVSRPWVLVEIGIAMGQGLRIVPFLYHLEPGEMPDMVRFKRGYNLNDFDAYLSDLQRRIRG